MEIKKLDTLGNILGQRQMPYLSTKNKGQQVLEVTYGHNDNGKQRYTYVGNTHRTGDIVTPFVTNKNGKTYRTLAVVRATHNLKNGERLLQNLPVPVKKIGATHQAWLPGYQERKEQDPNFTAKQWAQEAKNRIQKIDQFGKPIGGAK